MIKVVEEVNKKLVLDEEADVAFNQDVDKGMVKLVEEVNKVLEEDNKKLVKEYNDFFLILPLYGQKFSWMVNGHGCCGGRGGQQGGQQGDGGGQQEVGQGVQ